MKKFFAILIFALISLSLPCLAKDITVKFEDGIYHIVLKGEKIKEKVRFVTSENLITAKEAHRRYNSLLTVNAGFFDPANQKSISYITTDRQTVEDPIFNENLTSDAYLRKNLDKILNRSEFRIIECYEGKTSYRYEIMPHKAPIDFACSIINAAQGGPLVYPELKLEEEFFVVRDEDGNVIRESASVLHKTSRTIIGVKDGDAHILIITDENPMDMYDVHELCKKLGLDRAMAFDGGSSTSMNYLNKYQVVSTKGDGAGRSVKSFLIIPKKKPR